MRAGTMVITSRVFRGESPTDVKPAYDRAPNIPAPPVPEEYADITFLEKKLQKNFKLWHYNVINVSLPSMGKGDW